METGSESVSQSSDIRNVLVFANLRLILNMILEFRIVVPAEQPPEDSLLNLLVIFLLKEIIVEKLHGC